MITSNGSQEEQQQEASFYVIVLQRGLESYSLVERPRKYIFFIPLQELILKIPGVHTELLPFDGSWCRRLVFKLSLDTLKTFATGTQLPPCLLLLMIVVLLLATGLLVVAVNATCCLSSLPAVLATLPLPHFQALWIPCPILSNLWGYIILVVSLLSLVKCIWLSLFSLFSSTSSLICATSAKIKKQLQALLLPWLSI